MTRWGDVPGTSGQAYAARFAALAATGVDVHGEARFCAALVPAPARVLDAGCGTGRVAVRLAELGYEVVGVDADASMLAEARRAAPGLPWILVDLADLSEPADQAALAEPDRLALEAPFHLVLAAGNVLPLVAPGTEARVVAAMAARLRPGGALVAGFGLDAAHLPLPQAPLDLADYDCLCTAAGLVLEARYGTWEGEPYDGGGYAVSVHRRSST